MVGGLSAEYRTAGRFVDSGPPAVVEFASAADWLPWWTAFSYTLLFFVGQIFNLTRATLGV